MSKSELEIRIAPDLLNTGPAASTDTQTYKNLLTLQEVRNIVKQAVGNEANVEHFSLKSYSDGKLGFLGSYQKLCVEVETSSGKETLSFFLKGIPYEVPSQAEYVLDKCAFLKERIFYRDIVPQLCQGYNDEQWMPVCYWVKDNLLVFEDLGAKGYSLRSKLFDKELIVSSLKTIARLHASSLLAEARLGTPLKEVYPEAFMENAFCEDGKTRTWFDVSVKAIVAIAEHLGLDASLIPKACELVFPAMEMSSTKRNVISHGDLWGNNLMFSNTAPPKCLLVDFQLLRYSPMAHDVVQLLYLVADHDFRVTWEKTMLKHYYSVLCEIINSTKAIAVEVPSWSELVEGMEEQRLAAVITAAIYFQTVLLDAKTGAEILNDPDSYNDFEFKDRNETVLRVMKIDPVYCKRVTEAVTELVQLSFRLDELPKPT